MILCSVRSKQILRFDFFSLDATDVILRPLVHYGMVIHVSILTAHLMMVFIEALIENDYQNI